MDNVKYASQAYDAGLRAYEKHGEMCWQWTEAGIYRKVDANEVKDWHALRAYQDAERKKGVPIELDSISMDKFAYQDYAVEVEFEDGSNIITDNVYLVESGFPEITQSFHPKEPAPGVMVALFTNFRWRAGYPKGGEHAA